MPALARGGDDRRLVRHPGLLTTEPARSRSSIPSLSRWAGTSSGTSGRPLSTREHLAVLAQHARRGHAGARQADDQVGPVRQRRPRGHEIDCW